MLTPASSYTITIRVRGASRVGLVYEILGVISAAGALVGEIDIVSHSGSEWLRDFTVHCEGLRHQREVVDAVRGVSGASVELVTDETFRLHLGGKIAMHSRVRIKSKLALSQAYTPGVGRVSSLIGREPAQAWNFTLKRNCIAIVSDGSAVLGLGDLGAEAALPVMEGKALLFKELGGVDAWPLCIEADTTAQIVEFCQRIAPTFGGINLEDISAPRCFEIEHALKDSLDIPVFHDDQHGTAIVALAGAKNALRVVGKRIEDAMIVVLGVGAAGSAVARFLLDAGAGEVIGVDKDGILPPEPTAEMHPDRAALVRRMNRTRRSGGLREALAGADVFIGLSAPGLLPAEWIKDMAPEAIVFAMANPEPEILPEEAAPYAAVVATGRSDYPNQINNVLAFPGIFRGALDSCARDINSAMKLAAAEAIAAAVTDDLLSPEYIVPGVLDKSVAQAVAEATAAAAVASGVAQTRPPLGDALPDV